MPCRMTFDRSTGSMLPPDSTATTGGSKAVGSSISAATAAAPAGSTTSLARSRQSDRVAGLQRARKRRCAGRLDGHDLDVWSQRADGHGDPRHQSAATCRHNDRLDLGALLEQLEADGALAGDDVGMVEGVDEHRA